MLKKKRKRKTEKEVEVYSDMSQAGVTDEDA